MNFFASIPARLKGTIRRVCTDIYDGYIQAAFEQLPDAEVVIDRFHVAKNYHAGVDELRKQEMRQLKAELPGSAYEELKGLMWIYRHHWWDLDEEQRDRLALLFMYSPALEKAYFLRHRLTMIFEASNSKARALEYLDDWQVKVVESGLSCFDRFLTTLANWRDEITNYFNDRHSSG